MIWESNGITFIWSVSRLFDFIISIQEINMEKQRKLLHKTIRRMADLAIIILLLACIVFATRGF